MPKKKLPYYDRKGYAYIYVNRQPVSLKAPNGRRSKTGTPEALCAYHRFSLGIDNSPTPNEHNISVTELSAGYLTHLKTKQHVNYDTVKTIVDDLRAWNYHFLVKQGYIIQEFTPGKLLPASSVRDSDIMPLGEMLTDAGKLWRSDLYNRIQNEYVQTQRYNESVKIQKRPSADDTGNSGTDNVSDSTCFMVGSALSSTGFPELTISHIFAIPIISKRIIISTCILNKCLFDCIVFS